MVSDRLKRYARPARDLVARLLRAGPRRIGWIDRRLQASLDFLIDCRTVRAHLSDAHDGQLTRLQAACVRQHVATCLVCKPVSESLDDTLSLLRDLRDEPP
jgi:hypothetical protein